uniref:L-type lectin-like domain-containing protein n=1 Tax=Parascaris univalens TaxID=6257 RepID=A0A915C657_PARUN
DSTWSELILCLGKSVILCSIAEKGAMWCCILSFLCNHLFCVTTAKY